METKILDAGALSDFACSLAPSFSVGILLAGDRLSCCDEAVGVEVDGKIVGVATIAPRGEMESGQPTIVAIYVLPDHRGQGYGRAVTQAAVERCLTRGFDNIRVDTLSTGGRNVVESLPDELRRHIDAHHLGAVIDNFPG